MISKKEILKQKIGIAAMQCFQKYGLEKTTLEDIAKVVGLNKSSLYYYYKNKEDIFVETALLEAEKYIENLQLQAIKKKSIEAQLWFYLEARFKYYINVLDFGKVSPNTLNNVLPRFFELYDDFRKKELVFLAALIKKAALDDKVKSDNAIKIASLLMDISDALKHSAEQRSILKGHTVVDYKTCLQDIKLTIALIFKKL